MKYYWDNASGKFLEPAEYFARKVVQNQSRSDVVKSPMVIRDIEPYRSMVTGEMITGRRQHRDHLRAHNCIEVGNEKPKAHTPEYVGGVAEDIKAAMEKHGVG